jgi:hypothetical protein
LRSAATILEGTVNTAAAAVLLVLITPIGLAAEPRLLGDVELDGVTAAGVFVDVASVATVFGDSTRTLTDARTVAVPGKWFDLGVGLTLGHGFACCGEDAEVAVGSTVRGVGDIVHHGTRAFKRDDGSSTQGLSTGYVVAVSFNEPLPSRNLRPARAQ